jgi:hypothetical protein
MDLPFFSHPGLVGEINVCRQLDSLVGLHYGQNVRRALVVSPPQPLIRAASASHA